MSGSASTRRWDEQTWKGRFFTIWAGQAFSLFGSSLAQFALVWWLTSTTGSATVLALSTLAALLPQILLSPIAGAVVDRGNRRLIMMAADGLIALLTLGLVFVFAGGLAQVWHVYAIMFARSALSAFHWPAMSASTSLMAPEKHLSRVAGLNQALYGAVNIIALPAGALLLAALPIHQALAIDVVTALMAVLPLVFIRVPQPERSAEAQRAGRAGVAHDMKAGLRYLPGWPGLLMIMALAGIMDPITNGPLLATLQSRVAPDMQGRVMSLLNTFATAMSPLSPLVAGPLSDVVGAQVWHIAGGMACIVLAAVGYLTPAVVNLERGRPVAPAASVSTAPQSLNPPITQ